MASDAMKALWAAEEKERALLLARSMMPRGRAFSLFLPDMSPAVIACREAMARATVAYERAREERCQIERAARPDLYGEYDA